MTPLERTIFRHLLRVSRKHTPHPELRVAGGWVRDKLLKRQTTDLDVATRHISGFKFAELLYSDSQSRPKEGVHTCAEYVPFVSRPTNIPANPGKSRHLETACVTVDDFLIDFVQLRTDVYSDETSRIPIIREATPEEDANRRDFTVNALFYNLHTRAIEDHTGKGLLDLDKCLLRTPLAPGKTLRDDPLRALRAVRFACKLQFDLCNPLSHALTDKAIHDVLRRKVSRERIGAEVSGIVQADANRGLRLLWEHGLVSCVFGEGIESKFDEKLELVRIGLKTLGERTEYERMIVVYACLVGKAKLVKPVMHGALRREKRLVRDVQSVIRLGEQLMGLARSWRQAGSEHKTQLWIQMAETLREGGEPLWACVAVYAALAMKDMNLVQELERSRLSPEVCRVPYAVDGRVLQQELGIPPGPEVGKALRDLMRVQLSLYREQGAAVGEHNTTAHDFVQLLKKRRAMMVMEDG